MRHSTSRIGDSVPVNPKSETIDWDWNCPGLGVRSRGSLSTWIVQWRVDSKTKKRTLGRYEEITRDKARGLAVTLLKASTALSAEHSEPRFGCAIWHHATRRTSGAARAGQQSMCGPQTP